MTSKTATPADQADEHRPEADTTQEPQTAFGHADGDEDEDLDVAPVRPDPPVSYRVLKRGDRKIHTGRHHPTTGECETYRKGAVVSGVPRSIAEQLEERGFVEIED